MEYWYKYRDDLWKKVTMNEWENGHGGFPKPTIEADEKLKGNIRRAVRQIESYGLCNDWEYFCTFTLNPAYRDRKDLENFRHDLVLLINQVGRKYGKKIKFLLVPELHKSKEGWHVHGLLSGILLEELREFNLSEKLPKYIRDKLKSGSLVYDWPRYRQSFGFVDVEPIRSRDAAARYITKYLTKDAITVTAKEIGIGKHLYYVSKGLIQPELIEKGKNSGCVPELFPENMVPGNKYEFEYGTVEWYHTTSN